ncbi:polymeric immunoglobulin receptor-like isoform X3 [Anarhichas minor]|uniref:polymeric immunoglobulin receptor-like isoform X3 n=1 Tax=Anarhichas minor TaxID=65739 RepID=UPI003F73C222
MRMWSLEKLLFSLCTVALSCVSSAAGSIHVSGYEGGHVKVSCPYSEGYEPYEKYLCKNDCGDDDVLIKTTEPNKTKYSIHDDDQKRVFTATISDLSRTDAGKYWCGVTRTGKDIYTEVDLEVGQEWCCVRSNKLSGIVGRPVTMQCPYSPKHSDNRKFLCKGDHRNNCTEMVTKQSRFTLQEDVSSSSFLVIVTELKAEDAGTYWCGSDSQWSVGNYTKIQLSAVFPQQTSTEISSTSTEIFTEIFTVVEQVGSQSTLIPGKRIKAISHFVVFTVLAVLLTLVFALVIVYKYKCNKVQGAGANVNRGKAVETEEGIAVSDIYENQDVVCSKQDSSKPKSACQHDDGDDDASETQQECVYQNYTSTEDIYTNQTQIEANRR